MDKPIVITHRNCYDGLGAAWAFRHFNGPDFDWVQWNFGDDISGLPNLNGKVVYLADMSFPRDVMMEKIILPSKRTYVFDHHKTAEAELYRIIDGVREKYNVNRTGDEIIFDMHRSGAGITWDYFERKLGIKRGFHEPRFNNRRSSWLIDAIEDRDIWRFAYEGTREIQAGLSTIPMTLEALDDFNEKGFDRAVAEGASILAYIQTYGEKAAKTAKVETVLGYEVPTLNVLYMNCSEHLHHLLEVNPDAPFVMGYFRRSDGLWQFSFRSVGDFDVSEIAKEFGGGGHKNAAGAQSENLPWEKGKTQ